MSELTLIEKLANAIAWMNEAEEGKRTLDIKLDTTKHNPTSIIGYDRMTGIAVIADDNGVLAEPDEVQKARELAELDRLLAKYDTECCGGCK